MRSRLFHIIRSIFFNFRLAIKGGDADFTTGSIDKAIFMLSVPMVLEMVMESLFAVVDVFFVSKVSVNAVATVGLTESVIMIVYSIAVGLSMATTALVARRVGEKKPKEAAVVAFQAIVIALTLSLIIGTLGGVFAPEILRLMGGDETLIAQGYGYTRVIFLGNATIMLIFLINAVFRGAGNASIAMRSLWLSNILNMILDPIFIFGLGPIPEMGVEGAAIATTIGRGTGVIYQLYSLVKGKGVIKLTVDVMKVNFDVIKNLIKVSIGGILQFLIETASWIFLVRIMAEFGSAALAGYQIAFRIIVFSLLPSWGMSNAAATLVGQNLGAKKPDRAEKSVWKTALYNVIFLTGVGLIFFVFAKEFVGVFTETGEVMDNGVLALKIICFGYVFFAYGMVMVQAFNGAGDTRTPTIINVLVFWIFQIPFGYWMAIILDFGPSGVFWAIAIAHSIVAVVGIILFKRGKWKLVEV
ncbi:MAG: MATE family efflux transporter [Bacteroidetes bacterium]|nr:MATE family efflux transporter [Bacteroidota bacterium]MDA1120255.1 MATE family efflux transporter [Bacteroidota bacterium]